MKRRIAMFLLLGCLLGLCGCGTNNERVVNAWNYLASVGFVKGQAAEKCQATLGKVGLYRPIDANLKMDAPALDDGFFDLYLQEKTPEQFIEEAFQISRLYREAYPWGSYSNFKTDALFSRQLKPALDVLAERTDQGFMKPSEYLVDSSAGYYAEHPTAEPQTHTKKVSGQFYTSTGENVHYVTKENAYNVTYYGDFAVEHCFEYEYQKGEYTWRNGEFIDRLPSWKTREYDNLYYRGVCIVANAKSRSDFPSVYPNEINGYLYFIETETWEGIDGAPYQVVRRSAISADK